MIISFRLDPSPRDIRVVRINDTTIQVFWSPVYHPPVERYLIHYNDKSEIKPESQWSLYTPDVPGATSAIIGGLKPDAMYNVRVNAEFSSANNYDPLHPSGTSQREGDLSEIHVADIYRRKSRPSLFQYRVTVNFLFSFLFFFFQRKDLTSCHVFSFFSQLIRVEK